jgi:hypothetical protein
MQKAHIFSGLRNSGEAYRQFRATGFVTGTHEKVLEMLRHRYAGAAIVVIGTAGVAGTLLTFWPR